MIDVEFIEAKVPSRAHWLVVAAMLLAALAAWLVDGWRAGQLTLLAESVHAVKAPVKPDDTALRAARMVPAYDASAREVFRRGRFPAQQALRALESVVVHGIAIDAISVAGTSVQVEMRAMNESTLREYLDHLNAGLPQQVWSIASVSTAGEPSPASLRVRLVSNWAE